ncbi:MAG: cytochrome c oxidase subunit II [Dehalococcoidia bacterium]|nr:cytochrome c oxidase subunit II [Dehalococcoidia bacterium]MDW8120528.1 cytochrome c oxidase subunit II [Chloroflexota bacterium]
MFSRLPLRCPRLVGVGLFLVIPLLLTACTAPQNTFAGQGDQARTILGLYWLLIGAAAFVGVVVIAMLLYAFFRFRHRPGAGEPQEVHGNTRLEIAWFLIPTIIVLIVAIPSWRTIFRFGQAPPPNALQVQVVAHQWWWEFRYLNHRGPDGNPIVSGNELYLPVGQPVALTLVSSDVIHSFWVPRLAGKMDANPGVTTRLTFTPHETGTFYGQCAEFCGLSHALMRFRVKVLPAEEFQQWVQRRQAHTLPPLVGDVQRGWEVFQARGCNACHTIDGTSARGIIGPNLTGMASRDGIAAMALPNTPEAMARWLRNPPAVKAGAKMPNLNLTDEEISALVAFMAALK